MLYDVISILLLDIWLKLLPIVLIRNDGTKRTKRYINVISIETCMSCI